MADSIHGETACHAILDFKNYRAKKTVNTIPYTSNLPQVPPEQVPMGHFNSKKVTVVGMGQVRNNKRYSIPAADKEERWNGNE